ncbi:hypothetical protein V5O48_003034 [Marasmius crinis-equi]|uniref:Transcription factor Iwr1 domain-containing protein n=1 Tax=Marasmius crinis-equi TaxID=585013 RepID=A0ABR3FTY6_9AGAR
MFKSAATKIAHNSTLPSLAGNHDLKTLQDLINAEKVVLSSLQKLSADFTRAADALRAWGMGEGEDLGDTLSASTNLLHHFANALSQYATHEHTIREHMKGIRSREEHLDELKRRRRAAVSKADTAEKKLSKMSPEHKNLHTQTDTLNRLRDEIRSMDSEIMSEEATLGDFKRATMKTLLGLKFGGLLECCEKGTVAGEFGKLVAMEIPVETTQPGMARSMYMSQQKVYGLLQDAQNCMAEIAFSAIPAADPRPPRPQQPELDNRPTGGSFNYNEHPSPPGNDGFNAGPNNYFASPPTMGTGHFMDPSDMSMGGRSSVPSSPTAYATPSATHAPASAPAPVPQFPNPDHMQSSFPRGDHFPLPGGDSDRAISPPQHTDRELPSGGRFATFPVRNNTQGGGSQMGYQLRDGPPMLHGEEAHQDDSFSSSIEAALNNGHNGRPSLDGPPPSYTTHIPHDDMGSLTSSPPRGMHPMQMDSPWQDAHSPAAPRGHERSRAITEDDGSEEGGLAYDRPGDDEVPPRQSHDGEPKHVRFGEVSDVDTELQRRHEEEARNDGPSVDPGAPKASSRRVPPPTFSPDDDEKELNAAAAREISRELDALNFSAHGGIRGGRLPEEASSPTSPRGRNDSSAAGSIPGNRGDVSPLVPPVAPFTQRGPSPRPESVPIPSSPVISTPTAAQSPLSGGPTSTHEPEEHPPASPLSPRGPAPALPNPTINAPDHRSSPSITSLRGGSPYLSDNLPKSPLGTRSTSSLVGDRPDRSPMSSPAPPPPGVRTISAAAFRRPARTNSDAPGPAPGGAPMADTSPLHLKKRLPASPYPASRGGDGPVPESRAPSGMHEHGRPQSGGDADDQYDYLAAYANDTPPGAGSPMRGDFGSLGQMRVTNEYGDRGGGLPPGASPPTPGGYSDGRFATNLEIIESALPRKKTKGGKGLFQFAQTVEDQVWQDEKQQREIQEQISRLARAEEPNLSTTTTTTTTTSLPTSTPPVKPLQASDPNRRYTIVEREHSTIQPKWDPSQPPPVLSSKELQAQAQNADFKMYDAVLERTEEQPMDPEIEKIMPLLQAYLKTSNTPATPETFEDDSDYVWDIFYHRPGVRQDPTLLLSMVGTVSGLPPLGDAETDSESEDEVEDEADEDSNAEEYYKNDYPDEEDSDSSWGSEDDFDQHSDFYGDDGSDHEWRG